jgi:hypothetical protein
MEPLLRDGDLLESSGRTPEDRVGRGLQPDVAGAGAALEQVSQTSRLTAAHSLRMIRHALGTLEAARSLSSVVCPPGFEQLHDVADGAGDLFLDLFGEEAGSRGRASIGATAPSGDNRFELWPSVEFHPDTTP